MRHHHRLKIIGTYTVLEYCAADLVCKCGKLGRVYVHDWCADDLFKLASNGKTFNISREFCMNKKEFDEYRKNFFKAFNKIKGGI